MKDFTSEVLRPLSKPTIWQNVVSLVHETKAVNLSQGAPEYGPQPFFHKNLLKASKQIFQQESDPKGLLSFRQIIAKFHSQDYKQINPHQNILVTSGASVALYCAFLTFLDPGDQLILFEPAFDFYRHHATLCKAKTINIKLQMNDLKNRKELKQLVESDRLSQCKNWQVDWKAFYESVTPKTKIIIINSPHNPTGKIFTQQDIDKICYEAVRNDHVIIVEDYVYQGFMFDEFKGKHMPKAAYSKHYPHIKDRVITIRSAGKMLEATGIRTGWVIAQKQIIQKMQQFHQFVLGTVPTLVQQTTAYCLQDIIREDFYYINLQAARLQHHRKQLMKALSQSHYDIRVAVPKSGYFTLVDISHVEIEQKYYKYRLDENNTRNTKDLAFCYQLAYEHGVVIVPCASFFCSKNKEEKFVRFAFCKKLQAIQQAAKRLRSYIQIESQIKQPQQI